MASGEVRPLTPETVSELAGEWDALLADAPTATPFQTRAWIESLIAERRGRGALLLAREGADLVGLMPLRVVARGWRIGRSFGVGPSDYLHPLVRGGFEATAPELLAEASAGLRLDLEDLHQMPAGTELAFGAGEEQARCLAISLPKTFDAYRKTLGKSLRYDVGRAARARAEGGFTIERASPDDLERHFETFLRLHRARWRARGLPGAFGGAAARFQRRWVRRAATEGTLRMATLVREGEAIGSIYGMALGRSAYFYQAGMDPAARTLSPGTHLVSDAIEAAIAEGRERFDMMRGDEPYKRRWMPTEERANMRVLRALTARGRVGEAAIRRAWGVESKVRARLEGGSLLPRAREHGS